MPRSPGGFGARSRFVGKGYARDESAPNNANTIQIQFKYKYKYKYKYSSNSNANMIMGTSGNQQYKLFVLFWN